MSSGIIRADFFPKQIIGADVYENDIFLANQQEIRDAMGRIIGEGVIDPTFSGLGLVDDAGAINNRRLSVTGDLPGQNGNGYVFKEAGNSGTLRTVTEGSRTITLHDPTWYENLPFENADGTTYRVYLSEAVWPVSVGVGKNGGRGYSRAVNGVGVVMNPSNVTDTGSFIQFQFSPADLASAFGIQMWNLDVGNREDANYSYDCVVWLDTDQAGVEIQTDDSDVAIAFGAKLVMDAGGTFLKINLSGIGDGKLGQSTVSTDVTHYKVAILGPLITTNNYDNDPAYLHVGTSASAIVGETIDTSGQIVFLSVSQAVAQTVEAPDELSYKGWITAPTTSFNATDIDVTSTGEAFINGIVVDTSNQLNLVPVSANAIQYVYYDGAASQFDITDDPTVAFGNNNLPLIQGETDGSSQFILTTVMRIPRRARRLNVMAELTVSETLSHRCMFTDLEECLTYAASFQSAIGVNTVGLEVELRGDITLTGILDIPEIYDLVDVVIKGRHTPIIQRGGGAYSSTPGSRIIWNYAGPIFDLESGYAMRGWTFKNIEFRYTNGANISGAACIIRSQAGATGLDSVTFKDCTVDGNNVLASQGGADGQLANVVNIDGGTVNGLTLDGCSIYTHGAVILNEGDAGMQNLKVVNCIFDNNDVVQAIPSTEYGGILDLTTAGAAAGDWIVSHNRGLNMLGPLVRAYRLSDAFIDHNKYLVDSNGDIVGGPITLGNLGTSDIHDIMIDHNKFACRVLGAGAVMRLVSTENGTDFTGIIIDHNIIDGDNTAGLNGIEVTGYITGGDFVRGVILGSNIIKNVDEGVVAGRVMQATVTNNLIQASVRGTSFAGDGTGVSGLAGFIVSGNYVEMVGTDCVAFDDSQSSEFDAYIYAHNFVDQTNVTTNARAWQFTGFIGGGSLQNTISGNMVVGGVASTIDRGVDEAGITVNTYIGNRFLSVETFMDTSSNTWIGNLSGLLTTGVSGWDSAQIIGSKFSTDSGSGLDIDLDMSNSRVIGTDFNADIQLTIDGSDTLFIGCRMDADSTSNVFVDNPSDVFFIGCDVSASEITIDDGVGSTWVGCLIGSSTSGDLFIQNNSDDNAFIGCDITPPLTIAALNDDLLMVGSRHGQACTIDSTSGSLVGSEFFSLTLGATSDNIAAVANVIVSGPIVDNGTNNQVANNVDT